MVRIIATFLPIREQVAIKLLLMTHWLMQPVNDSTDSQHGKAEINTLRLRREGGYDELTATLLSNFL